MQEYKRELINLKNSLITLNNEDNEFILNNEKESIERQLKYMNRVSFNLYKIDNVYLKRVLDLIYYKILKNRTEKKLAEISLEYEIAILGLTQRIQKRKKQIEEIDKKIEFIDSSNDSSNNNRFVYKNIEKNN